MGDWNHGLDVKQSGALVLDIYEIHWHPSYDEITSYNDVAILTTKPVKFTEVSYALMNWEVFFIQRSH